MKMCHCETAGSVRMITANIHDMQNVLCIQKNSHPDLSRKCDMDQSRLQR